MGTAGALCYIGLADLYNLANFGTFPFLAHVAELADAYGSGPYGATRGGSSPLVSSCWDGIRLFLYRTWFHSAHVRQDCAPV